VFGGEGGYVFLGFIYVRGTKTKIHGFLNKSTPWELDLVVHSMTTPGIKDEAISYLGNF